jgi:hypothetical protein
MINVQEGYMSLLEVSDITDVEGKGGTKNYEWVKGQET